MKIRRLHIECLCLTMMLVLGGCGNKDVSEVGTEVETTLEEVETSIEASIDTEVNNEVEETDEIDTSEETVNNEEVEVEEVQYPEEAWVNETETREEIDGVVIITREENIAKPTNGSGGGSGHAVENNTPIVNNEQTGNDSELSILSYDDFKLSGTETVNSYANIYNDIEIGGTYPEYNNSKYSNVADYVWASGYSKTSYYIMFLDKITTARGIGIGSTFDDVVRSYGSNYVNDNGFSGFNTGDYTASYAMTYGSELTDSNGKSAYGFIQFNMSTDNKVMTILINVIKK